MKTLFKVLLSLLLLSICSLLLYLNLRLYASPTFEESEGQAINQDLFYQFNFLKQALHQGAGKEMQQVYPEGFVFMHALYGLNWCDVADKISKERPLYKEATEEIAWANDQVHSNEGKLPFDHALFPAYGAFYAGWSNYLLGRKLAVLLPATRDSTDIGIFRATCENIATAIRHSNQPFLASYRESIWPADIALYCAWLPWRSTTGYGLPGTSKLSVTGYSR